MDAFRTEVSAPEFNFSVDHNDHVFMVGSCFTENVGDRLRRKKFELCTNPFGIHFNPFSIMNSLERMLGNRPYQEADLVKSGEHWVSLDHHGRFNNRSIEECLEGINKEMNLGRIALEKANAVFVTLGSAWVYEYKETGHLVANCHKIPNRQFTKRILSFQETNLILAQIPELLKAHGIQAEVIFTVSPIRHWKDGPSQNQRSKSTLISAVHNVVDQYDNCHYFPSYEMMMDDLRDYRFYKTDMLHPTEQALDYVWMKFEESFFSDETRIICKELLQVIQASEHRPMDPESNSYQRFLRKQLDLIDALESKYTHLDLSQEREAFSKYVLK